MFKSLLMKSILIGIPTSCRTILLGAILLLMGSSTFAISVTFRVDMTHFIAMGFFKPGVDTVLVAGDFNNWAINKQLVRVGSTNIYSTSLTVNSNSTYEYKFYCTGTSSYNDTHIDSFEGLVGDGKNGNRILQTGTTDITLPTVFYSNFKPGNAIAKQKAETIAKNWYKHWNPDPKATSEISEYIYEEQFKQPFAHIFNFSSGGWVVVSATDRLRPIMCYNFINRAQYMGANAYNSLISLETSVDVLDEWNDLYQNDFSRYSSDQVLPLLTTHWHQWWPYNAYYPLNPVYYKEENGHYRLGCTVTAGAQMMKYWNYPESGNGVISCENDPVTGLNYHDLSNDHFRWYNMPDFLNTDTSLTEDVYGPSALVNYSFWMTLQNLNGELYCNWISSWARYFDYSPTAEVVQEWNVSAVKWRSLYNTELENGRPVMMSGSGDTYGQGGHAFICDGYQANDYYHVNLGWAHINGYLDGFYPFNNFAGHHFNHVATVGVQPAYCQPNYKREFVADANTVLLMHFNDNLNNESSLGGNAISHGSGLSFESNDSLGLGKCLRIDNSTSGKNSFLTFAHNAALNLTDNWTIEAWIMINSWDKEFNRDPFLFMKHNNDWSRKNFDIKLFTNDKKVFYEYRSAAGNVTTFDSQPNYLAPGQWYHIAFIKDSQNDNTKVLIYNLKNELVYFRSQPYNTKEDWEPGTNDGDLNIGSWGGDNWGLFDGYIDELRISNVARTIDEVASVVYAQTYPGDADNDGQVKAADVLSLGFFYGEAGEPREAALQGCSWQLNNRIPWDKYRATYADCNGDGIVNSEDILCIGYNYNKISSNYKSQPILKSATTASLQVQCQPAISTLKPGDTFDLIFNVENGCDLAGTSLSVTWDISELKIGSENDLVVGNIWENNPLVIKKINAEVGELEIAISNLKGKSIRSDGELFRLKATLTKTGFSPPAVCNAVGMDKNGEMVSLCVNTNGTATGAEAIGETISELKCYPNPTTGVTQLTFTTSGDQPCTLRIYNAQGKEVDRLIDNEKPIAGICSYEWDATKHSKGIYLCKLEIGKKVFTQKLIVK